MKVMSHGKGAVIIELTSDEAHIIDNALNEVCNGIQLEGEFDTRMGCSIEEARELIQGIHGLFSK